MRSSDEYLIGLVSVIQGLALLDALLIDAHNDPCVAKIISCDWYRKPFSLYQEKDIGMFTNIDDLDNACKKQAAFIKCIARAENFCKQTTLLPMAEEMIKSRGFTAEICRHGSSWKQVYLREANCLNAHSKEAFKHCIVRLVLTSNMDVDYFNRGCKYGRDIIECSTTALQGKCGYYAGNIFKKILKFHSLSDYTCFDLKPKDIEDSVSSTQDYDRTEAISISLESENLNNEATEEINGVNPNSAVAKLYPENLISFTNSPSEEAFAAFNFVCPVTEEPLMTEFSSERFEPDTESNDVITATDKLEFPELPKYLYLYKNRTTFALYEDLEMGHMNYIGCGEADVFWVISSSLKSHLCFLSDLKSEYSEAMFKCTLRIDVPCSPKLHLEDRNKKAEVFYRRYVATVLTAPNNERSEVMAIMNAHYLKLFPSPSMNVPEKKVDLWTDQAIKTHIEQTEAVKRKGSLEWEDDDSDNYPQASGSGQKWETVTVEEHPDFDEEYYENGNFYYPLDEEDDVLNPGLLSNNIIFIDDDKGDLISLYDHRSPIHSKSVYEPHSLFRPRIGEIFESTDLHSDEVDIEWENNFFQSSIFREISEFLDKDTVSRIKSNQQGYCSEEKPCATNSAAIFDQGIKPNTYIPLENIKTFDPFKESNRAFQKVPSPIKLSELINMKEHLISKGFYTVHQSTKIKTP